MRARTCPLSLAALLLALPVAAQVPRPGQSFALSAPDVKPVDIAVCSSGDSILFAGVKGGDPRARVYAIFRMAGSEVKEILSSGPGQISASPEGHQFAIIVQSPGGPYELIIVDDQGTLVGLQRSLQRVWDPQWSSNGRELLLRTYAEGAAKPAGNDEFSAFTVYSVYDQRLKTVPVNPPGLSLRFAGGSSVQVFPMADARGGGVRVFDSDGNAGSPRAAARGTMLSATGLYYLSPQTEPRGAFAVFDAATHRQLREFNRGGKTAEGITPLRWHPKNDKWLAVWHDAADGSRSLEVFDPEGGKTVRSVYKFDPASGDVPWAWAPDGGSIVIFHSGKFWFEPVK